jgi:hypothetical protein
VRAPPTFPGLRLLDLRESHGWESLREFPSGALGRISPAVTVFSYSRLARDTCPHPRFTCWTPDPHPR